MADPPPVVTDAEIREFCDWVEARETKRTFARDDLAPGNAASRRSQAIWLEVVRRLRAGMAH